MSGELIEGKVAFQVRMSASLANQINARMHEVGEMSRNQWINRALAWALEQPPRETAARDKVRT